MPVKYSVMRDDQDIGEYTLEELKEIRSKGILLHKDFISWPGRHNWRQLKGEFDFQTGGFNDEQGILDFTVHDPDRVFTARREDGSLLGEFRADEITGLIVKNVFKPATLFKEPGQADWFTITERRWLAELNRFQSLAELEHEKNKSVEPTQLKHLNEDNTIVKPGEKQVLTHAPPSANGPVSVIMAFIIFGVFALLVLGSLNSNIQATNIEPLKHTQEADSTSTSNDDLGTAAYHAGAREGRSDKNAGLPKRDFKDQFSAAQEAADSNLSVEQRTIYVDNWSQGYEYGYANP